ncbi:MAG: TetR/AcrR family transcriptional regulator [Leptospira sp.]|nr:TetR/AcrR family transcriptional regulator [Leptospira sp.]
MKSIPFKDSYHHGDLKTALRLATLNLLQEESYQSISLRKVAKKAGVSQSAPYRHYPNLESLLVDVAIYGFQLLREKLQSIQAKFKKYPLLKFRESGVCYVNFALSNPDLFQIMYGNQISNHALYPDLTMAEESSFSVLEDIIQENQKSGNLSSSDIHKTAIAAWTMVHGIAILFLGKQVIFQNSTEKSIKKITKEMLETLYIGIKDKK